MYHMGFSFLSGFFFFNETPFCPLKKFFAKSGGGGDLERGRGGGGGSEKALMLRNFRSKTLEKVFH